MTDQLNLSIYKEICKYYIEQIDYNIINTYKFHEQAFEYEKKYFAKLNYIEFDELKTICVDGFKCSFLDVFMIKKNFDKLLKPKERFYYFKEPYQKPKPKIRITKVQNQYSYLYI